MRELTDQVELTPDQRKAFGRLKRAFNDCKKMGVRFAMSDETLIAMNGENIITIYEGSPCGENHLELQDCSTNELETGVCPYVDCNVTVEVKN